MTQGPVQSALTDRADFLLTVVCTVTCSILITSISRYYIIIIYVDQSFGL